MNILNKTNKKYLLRLALLSIPLAPMMSSCADDFLEAQPRTSVSVENAFDTPERVEAQANGLYATIKSGAFLGGRYQVYNDVRAEEFINRLNNGVTGAWAYAHTIGGDDTYLANFWITGYLAINRSNLFLEGLDANATKIDPAKLQQYKGEAKFVRALTYFYLVQIYAKPYAIDNGASPGLPLRLKGETGPDNNGMARSTVAQIYAQILKDLNEAEAELPSNYSSGSLNTTRAHKNTAIALKTRVYLTMKNYAKVIEEGNKIVSANAPFTSPNRVAHALQSNIKNVFTNYTTTESIFSMPMTNNSAPGTQNQLGYYYNGSPNGNREYYLNVNATGIKGIYTNSQFRDTDARKTDLTATISGQRYVTKFSGVTPFTDWVPIIRYSEVLLNLAEAEAEVGSQTRAIALLEAVHKRSDATWTYTGTTKTDLIDAILTERRIELLAEGFRTNDIMRRGLAIPSVGAGAQIPVADSRYTFPIPTREYQTNPLL
ncbi:RagB/SusD family nutrient uptake outer membrane protein [Pontibacter cellulosilyticus]|uniref:RagB/SusD family nutrient uptake outer membrane protein n=1 Tax=Pontibacter cellulosilyticus TaxID=1720253 RepID=A0A923SNG9_9BACT|nr:RagB/SusD family nutrient uptake outer membrane protein [Pontibacter cellulosilyticus]MBC5993190.1 RagB/SusD family nutrient uptake outer membrane protein [Pontibacter cellulosilyticus]